MAIHPTAIIDSSATLASDVEVGPYVVIGPRVEVGSGTTLGAHAVLVSHVKLGVNCRVHPHAIVGDVAQDIAFKGGDSFVEIGDRVIIREGATIHRGTKEGTVTRVGDDCFLMANSHLAHNVALGKRVIVANGALLAGYVEVGDAAFVSGNVVVHQFCKIGRLAMASGGSVVGQDLPPFCVTHSDHRNTVVGLNVVGLRRAGMSSEERLQVKRAFALLYREGLSPKAAAARIAAELPPGPAHELVDFIHASKRGLCGFIGALDSDGE
ncbi:MAG: acyl-ACP--UDP-N-acetylglucosamine O-acyltransferase [Kiritimatiellae bacterium]|nr:acyl-ACP--UDP-N-acetylglucosamine O-acyltransferase [Kiritimatiellia bacterium]